MPKDSKLLFKLRIVWFQSLTFNHFAIILPNPLHSPHCYWHISVGDTRKMEWNRQPWSHGAVILTGEKVSEEVRMSHGKARSWELGEQWSRGGSREWLAWVWDWPVWVGWSGRPCWKGHTGQRHEQRHNWSEGVVALKLLKGMNWGENGERVEPERAWVETTIYSYLPKNWSWIRRVWDLLFFKTFFYYYYVINY